jgi:hypothetical protein
MELMQKLGKYHEENWIVFDDAQNKFDQIRDKKSCYVTEMDDSSEENSYFEEYDDGHVLDDIETVKDVVAFSEITSFKGKLLSDMEEKDRIIIIPHIINSLSKLDARPMAYTVKDDSIKLAWYLNNMMHIWTLSDLFDVASIE